jgi:16S rRNA (adenine1518-N6/adenine1519-N6)-dimethyltransferase
MTPLLTPSAARAILDRHGLAMRKRDGQNLLIDPNTVRRIVAAAELAPDDVVLEVGPGIGSLTLALAPPVGASSPSRSTPASSRRSPTCSPTSQRRGRPCRRAGRRPRRTRRGGPARLVANLPYNVATPIVIEALASGAFTDAFVMVQREVGERWAARPGDPRTRGQREARGAR